MRMRAKRASEFRIIRRKTNIFLKRREGGPKGRPSEASLKNFFACWLFYSQDFVLELGQKKSRDWLKYRLANPGDCPESGEPIR